jgi:alkylhydroperoxidase family enzyme
VPMTDRRAHVERLARAADRLRAAVLDRGTATTAEVRRAAYGTGAVDPALADFITKVREHAHRVTDADVGALRSQGLSADAIFEVTVAAALGAAQRRLDAGLALVDTAPER